MFKNLTRNLSFRIPKEIVDEIAIIAEETERTKTKIVIRALRLGIEAYYLTGDITIEAIVRSYEELKERRRRKHDSDNDTSE